MSNCSVINFYNDKLRTTTDNSTIYVAVRDILANIGFDENKINNQGNAWVKDPVISRGIKNFLLDTNGGPQNIRCIDRRFVSLALAKISITPAMISDKSKEKIVDKLIRYQEECADILYKHFENNKKTVDDPLTREEMAMYYSNTINSFREYCNTLALRDKERDKFLKQLLETQTTNIEDITKALTEIKDLLVNKINKPKEVTTDNNESNNSLNPINSLLSVDYDFVNICAWKKELQKKLEMYGYKTSDYITTLVWPLLCTEYENLQKAFSVYKNTQPTRTASKMNIICQNKLLRSSYEKHLDSILEDKGMISAISTRARYCPARVKNVASKLGKPSPRIYEKIYEKMRTDYLINIDDVRDKCAEKYNIKRCSYGFAIDDNENVFKAFCSIVNNMIKESKVS